MAAVNKNYPRPKPDNSFKPFQALPELVRNSLVIGLKHRREGESFESRDLAQFIIDRYDMNQTLPIGELIIILERFLDRGIHVRMVNCYVDHGCNMLAAKLAWREDY